VHTSQAYLIANFGGPRHPHEIESFLTALLTDQEVIRTSLPAWLHGLLFKRIARKRARQVEEEYAKMGGKSPIFEDTEAVAEQLRAYLSCPVITFHRYLPSTHAEFCHQVKALTCDTINVFPMFPQFTYATTGSIAKLFQDLLPGEQLLKLRWIKSYPQHPAYIYVMQTMLQDFLQQHALEEENTVLLFSAHGLPLQFIETGDLYLSECQASYQAIMKAFPKALGRLCFQSKFGPGEWIKPYTLDSCQSIKTWCEGRKSVVFIPVSFTSDHIETLVEIEDQYMPIIRQQGLQALRLPAMNRRDDWVRAIVHILGDVTPVSNAMLNR